VDVLVPKRRQRGGAFGTLVLLVAIGAIGYYAWNYYFEAEEAPSCRAQLNRCISLCRKTASEAPQAQACQETCQRDADACERK
jgi:uncharacterized membrane protein YebE (DUF533 family)